MSAESNAVRALADSGTPAPWWLGDHGRIAAASTRAVVLDMGMIDADAAKIVAAVNALPKVADLVEAVEDAGHREGGLRTAGYCVECSEGWPCPTIRARDALVAALGVTE